MLLRRRAIPLSRQVVLRRTGFEVADLQGLLDSRESDGKDVRKVRSDRLNREIERRIGNDSNE